MKLQNSIILRCAIGAIALTTALAAKSTDSSLEEDEDNVYDMTEFSVFGEMNSEVSVATRLPLTDRETPQTISLIDSSRLENESMFTLDDVMRNVTGVNVSLYDTQRPLYFSRGFQITDFQVDGIPTYSNDTNQEYDTALYEMVEIVRGANGLFSGTGKPSGTVNFHRKKAGKKFAANIHGSYGSWDYYRAQVDVNAPFSEDGRFRSRFVAAYTDRDSFRDRYQEQKLAYLATLAGDLTETTTLTVGYQYQDNDPTASVWGTITPLAGDGTPSELPHTTNFATNWAKWQRESGTLFVNLEQKLGEQWQLKAAYNLSDGEEHSQSVYDNAWAGSALNKEDGSGIVISGTVWDTDDTRESFDVFVTGKYNLFNREHDLVFGASFSDHEADSPNNDAGYNYEYQIPNFYTWDGSAPEIDFNYTPGSAVASTQQSGFYASTRLRLTDALSGFLGARISNWETEEFERNDSGNNVATYSAYEVDNELTPYIGFTYELNENTTLYASYTSIFQPQNKIDIDRNNLDPIEGNNFEVGLKANFADNRAIFTAALFKAEQDNFAVVHPDYVGIPSTPEDPTRYIGVNGTKSQGAEFQVSGLVSDEWSVIFGYTFNDTKRHEGDPIWANLPKNLLQLSTHYQFKGRLRNLALGGGLTWQSKITGSLSLPSGDILATTQDAYSLVNLHVNYRFNENFSATLSAKNAFNEIYLANLDYPNYGEPRNVILSLKWQY